MKYIVTLIVAGLLLMPAISGMAQEEETPKAKPEIKEIPLTGKISKEEKKIGERTKVTYFLTDADGNKVTLPIPRISRSPGLITGTTEVEAPAAIKLDEFVGQEVELVGKGTETEIGGKKHINIKEINKITVIKKAEKAAEKAAGEGSEGL